MYAHHRGNCVRPYVCVFIPRILPQNRISGGFRTISSKFSDTVAGAILYLFAFPRYISGHQNNLNLLLCSEYHISKTLAAAKNIKFTHPFWSQAPVLSHLFPAPLASACAASSCFIYYSTPKLNKFPFEVIRTKRHSRNIRNNIRQQVLKL